MKARHQLEQGTSDEANALMEEILKSSPDFTLAQKQLAVFYGANDRNLARSYELGIKARRALPQDRELNRVVARVSYKRKEYRLAVQILEELARVNELTADDLFVLGMAQSELKEKEKSRENLEKALKAGLGGQDAIEANKILALEAPSA